VDVRNDLDFEKDTETHQEIYLTTWEETFDELADMLEMLVLMGR
jgi:hypothetical protein